MKLTFSQYGIKNTTNLSQLTLQEVATLIKENTSLQVSTEYLRSLTGKEQDEYKINYLPYAIFGGIFNERKDTGVIKESGLVCIDIDNLPDVTIVINELSNSILPVMYFVSPKGKGLKVVFVCNKKYSFKENYSAYSRYLIQVVCIAESHIDKGCSNISRACILCHDYNVFFDSKRLTDQLHGLTPVLDDEFFTQTNKHVLETVIEDSEENQTAIDPLFLNPTFCYQPFKLDYNKRNGDQSFITLCRIVSRDANEFKIGNRHNWLVSLAVKCVLFGMEKEYALEHFKTFFSNHPAVVDTINPFDEKNDLIRVFDDVYLSHVEKFASWTDQNEEWQTPFIPEYVYNKLPTFIKSMTGLFEERERDVFFLGTLTLLSACFPKVYGIYNNRRYHANLFLFVSAPAASGKGVLNWVRMLGSNIHQIFLDNYKAELANYEELEEEEKRDACKPALKKFFIPANNTSAKLMQSLEINNGMGVVFDTEADTLSRANKSDHGNFSDIYRKAFEHETLECERKTNNEYFCINAPALSVIISGTKNQVKNLVNDLENGLTSRFMFYSFISNADWKDVFAVGEDHDSKIKSESVRLTEMVKPYLFDYLDDPKDEIQFSFSENQQKQFNDWFSIKLGELDLVYGKDINASIYRMGTILFRMAMTLTIVRNLENPSFNKTISNSLLCDDIDFEIAINVVDCLLHHTAAIFSQLKGKRHQRNHRPLKEVFYEKLPVEFNRENAMEVARIMQIPEKTAESYLARAIESEILKRLKHNHYKKVA
jgi:hypothetical protein